MEDTDCIVLCNDASVNIYTAFPPWLFRFLRLLFCGESGRIFPLFFRSSFISFPLFPHFSRFLFLFSPGMIYFLLFLYEFHVFLLTNRLFGSTIGMYEKYPHGVYRPPRPPLLPAKKRWLRKKQCRHRETASVHRNLSLRRKKLPFIREATPSARHTPQKRRTADISRPFRPHNKHHKGICRSGPSGTSPHRNGLASLLRPPSVFPKKLCRAKVAEEPPLSPP